VAVSGTEGIYAFRYLPGGTFEATAFEDLNRNGEIDAREARGRGSFEVAAGDTVISHVALLVPDTTPAVLTGVQALDSVVLQVDFDEYLDPTASLEDVEVTLESDVGIAPAIARIMQGHEYSVYVATVTDSLARIDSIAAAARGDRAPPPGAAGVRPGATGDTARAAGRPGAPADTAGAAGRPGGVADTARVPARPGADTTRIAGRPGAVGAIGRPGAPPRRGPPPLEGPGLPASDGSPATGPDGQLLPAPLIVVQLAEPLPPEAELRLRVSGIVNINGVGGGGGEAVVQRVEPEPAADSLGVPDSLAAPDTLAVPDTLVSDSLIVPDTLRAPDTLAALDASVAPDTTTAAATARHRWTLPTARRRWIVPTGAAGGPR
jgi:hypothetical protein